MTGKKVIVLEVEINGVKSSISDIAGLKAAIAGTKKELESSKFGSDKFNALNKQLGALETTMTDVRNVSKEAGQNFVISADKGQKSYRALAAELNKLRATFRDLSEAERNSNVGANIRQNIQALDRQLKAIDGSLGQFQRNVGNYKSAAVGFADILTGGIISGGATAVAAAGIQKINQVLDRGEKDIREYGAALADLSAILGLTGEDLARFEQAALDLEIIQVGSEKIVTAGKDILEAFKLIGSAQPELLKSESALQAVAKAAIVLQLAAGGTLRENVEAITTTLAQFNLDASKSSEVINVLAAGSKEGAAEIADLTESTKEFGTVAAINNVTLNDSVAILEVLADRQLKGSRAGIQLRNVLTTLASVDALPPKARKALDAAGVSIEILGDKTLTFGERLKELQKLQGDTSKTTQVFGKENLAAATILIESGNRFQELSTKIEGTQQAYEQASIRAKTYDQSVKNLNARITNFLTSTGEGADQVLAAAFNALGESITDLGEDIQPLKQEFSELGSVLGDLKEDFTGSAEGVNVFATVFDFLRNSVTRVFTPLRKLLEVINGVGNAIDRTVDSSPFLQGAIEKIGTAYDKLSTAIRSVTESEETRLKRASDAFAKSGRGQSRVKQLTEDELKIQAALDEAAAEEKERNATSKKERDKELKSKRDAKAEELRIAKLKAERGDNTFLKDLQALKDLTGDSTQTVKRLEDEISLLKSLISKTSNPVLFETASKSLEELERQLKQVQDLVKVGIDPFKGTAEVLDDLQEKSTIKDIGRKRQADEIIKNMKIESNKETQDAIDEENDKRDTKRQKKQEDFEKDLKEASINAASQISNAFFQIQQNQIQQQLDAQLSALDKESQRKIELAQGDEEKIRIIEFQAQKKKEAIEKAAAEKRKRIALAEAVIQGALAVIEALPNPLLVALAAITTAANVAVIQSQQFAKGGKIKMGDFAQGRTHATGGIQFNTSRGRMEVEHGEFMDRDEHGNVVIVNRRSSSQFRRELQAIAGKSFSGKGQMMSDINSYAGFGKRFDLGGQIPAFVRVNVQQSASNIGNMEVTLSNKDINTLSANIGRQVQRGSRNGTRDGANDAINQNRRRDSARQRAAL